ncbi:S41 family peptidase [Clavibacter sp. VKM Ac-2542]|uniref:S41 family peptidase n=1 Tax=Clavibacter sp. VKM Ac-2542 TaxID=2783811 RepID=UPI00188CE3D5|nr:S41 family peptidase [Clavibacter sp. VKM Ac-2542]MBF4622161.1 S41 family peptidase [Clavibacter sp. VKM Ac-2542]
MPSIGTRRRVLHLLPVAFAVAVVVLIGGTIAATPSLERAGLLDVPPSPQRYADMAVDLMVDGLQADPARVAEVRAHVDAQAAKARNYAGTHPALSAAAKELGGEHSSLLGPAEAAADFGDSPPVSAAAEPRPTVTTADGITTIVVPAIVGGDEASRQRYVDAGAQALVAAVPATTRGWVVDLRGNHGGDIWPMLAAVSPLLDEGQVMSFESAGGSVPVTVAGGAVAQGGDSMATSDAGRVPAGVPIAVLTDGMTVSSGEAVAIAFVGQDGVRSFGQPTYGFSTGNEPRTLPDGAIVNLTVTVDADRTGRRYGGPVVPDVVVDDAGVTAAVDAWFDAPR